MDSLIRTLVPISCGELIGLAMAVAWVVLENSHAAEAAGISRGALQDLLFRIGIFITVPGISLALVSTKFPLDFNFFGASVVVAFGAGVVIHGQFAHQVAALGTDEDHRGPH